MVADLLRTSHRKPVAADARSVCWHIGLGMLLFGLGIFGLLHDAARTAGGTTPSAALYAFALLLCGSIAVRFAWGVGNLRNASRVDIDGFVRLSSRLVYLLLYSLLGISQAACMLAHEPRWERDTVFRPYFACGIAALVLIRVFARRWLLAQHAHAEALGALAGNTGKA